MRRSIDRRRFLTAAGLASGFALLSSPRARGAVRVAASPRVPGAHRTLVVLQLAGGNDGLSTVVPYGDDAYHRARPAIAHAESDVLPLDDYRGLHRNLERMRAVWDAGKLAIVEGVGYPDPNRSHFKSFDIWHAASARGRGEPNGWLGRLVEAAWKDEGPNTSVHVGGTVPYSLHSSECPPVSFVDPRSYHWAGEENEVDAYDRAGEGAMQGEGSTLDYLRRTLTDGQRSSRQVRWAAARYETPVKYRKSDLGEALRDVAALIDGDVGCRVLSVERNGFDTHTDQKGGHDSLMRDLDLSLGAFLEDLERTEAGRNTLVVVFSEFGRRVKENGALGTDHGTAGPMLVAGPAVKGGLYGEHPSLTRLDKGDLRYTTDFRRVYATAIERWFGVPNERVLGERYEPLDLV